MATIAKPKQFMIPKAPPKRKMDRRLKDKPYMAWLHKLECAVSGGDGERLTVQHIMAGRESFGKKEDDSVSVPLMGGLHLYQYGKDTLEYLTERVFWNRHGIDALALARDLRNCFERYGDCYGSVLTGKDIIRAHRQMGSARIRWGIKVFDERGVA